MISKIRVSIAILLLSVIFLSGQVTGQDTDASYQAYLQAYRNYQNAVSSKLSNAALNSTLNSYRQAKEAYERTLNKESGNADAAANAESIRVSQSNEEIVNYSTSAMGSDAQRNLANHVASLPAELRAKVEELRTTDDKRQAAAIIAELEKFVGANPNSPHATLLKYEMASGLDRLAIDQTKAAMLFTEVSKNTGSAQLANWAKHNLNYIKGKQYKAQWHKVMQQKFNDMTSAFNKYKNTSWLAVPVKATRGVSYMTKSASYISTQNKHEDFLLWYESTQAPFLTSVYAVFNDYQNGEIADRHDNDASIRLIYSNYQSWYARWKIMSEARSSIDIQYFIIENDAFGIGLLGLVLKKAREGVKVRLMVDVRGSNKLSLKVMSKGYLEELAKHPNVQVKIYNPFEANLLGAITDLRRIVSSNHDKILIADGRYAIVGGRNIADEYLVDAIDDPKAWRDTDVLIDSVEVSAQLQKAFEEEFEILKAFEVGKSILGMTQYRTTQMEIGYACMESALNRRGPVPLNKKFEKEKKLLKKFNEQLAQYKNMTGYPSFELAENSHNCPVHILDNNSLSGPRGDITENIVKYIDSCRREIIIQNPYVVITPRAEAALIRASKRGVPIIVHTNSPQTSDSFPTEAMLYRDWRNILRDMPTMRIFARINEGQLHAKNFVFDSKIGVVGTYNFDFLSEKVNSEVVAVIKSNAFAKELRNEIVFDIGKAAEYHLATADKAEFGPGDIENPQKLWLIKLISKMGWLKPLF